MAADHVADGVRVNCVCPGTVDTAWVGRLLQAADDPAAERAALEARQAIGRLVRRTRSRGPSSIWRARGQGRRPGRRSMSMGASPGYGFGPAGDGRAQGGVGYRPGSGRRRGVRAAARERVGPSPQIARSNIRNYRSTGTATCCSLLRVRGEDLDADLRDGCRSGDATVVGAVFAAAATCRRAWARGVVARARRDIPCRMMPCRLDRPYGYIGCLRASEREKSEPLGV